MSTHHVPPPPRRRPVDPRTDAERIGQIIRHQALGHAVRYCANATHPAQVDVLAIAAEFAQWIERGETS